MKKANNKALMAVLAITFGTSQVVCAENTPNDQLFNLREIKSSELLIAHTGLDGNCPGHAGELAKQQEKYEKKKAKKKKKREAIENTEANYSYRAEEAVVDEEESSEEE